MSSRAAADSLRRELDACREHAARLEKRLQLAMEDQQRQEHINDNQRALLYKVNKEYEVLLERNKALADELHSKNVHLSGIIERAPAPVITMDAELRVTSCNPRATEFFNLESAPCAELDSLFPLEFSHKLQRFSRYALRMGKPVVFEALYASPGDGKGRMLELTVFPVPRGAGQAADLCCVVQDLSPVREELAERFAQAQLVELGALSAGIAHEVNNPINGVINYLQLCQDTLPMLEIRDADVLAQSLEQAQNLAGRVAAVVHAILGMAAPRTDEVSSFSIGEAVGEALLLLRYQLRRNSIALRQELPDELPLLEAKRVEIVQIIQNLVINAIQAHAASPPGHAKGIWISCSAAPDERALELIVRDNGPGIDAEQIPRLFHPFVTTREDGTGLGLYLSQKYARSNGGDIAAANAPNGGAAFTLSLPLAPDTDTART